jgi:hypothetical protein
MTATPRAGSPQAYRLDGYHFTVPVLSSAARTAAGRLEKHEAATHAEDAKSAAVDRALATSDRARKCAMKESAMESGTK